MNLISPQEVIQRYSISYQTLNYYTNLGLFSVVERRGNQRMYNESELANKIHDIVRLKNEGYPLQLIVKKLNHKVPL